jgi:hypothetical protein
MCLQFLALSHLVSTDQEITPSTDVQLTAMGPRRGSLGDQMSQGSAHLVVSRLRRAFHLAYA